MARPERRRGAARRREAAGFSLAELLLAAVILALLASLAIGAGGRGLALLRLENATRRVLLGLELGRSAAQRTGAPCALALAETGWRAPEGSGLPACEGVELALDEGVLPGGIAIAHNLPAAVRFTSNGLVLDGGSVQLQVSGEALVRCVVVSLPLGVTRVGRQGPAGCEPDPLL
ncbi:GspH/FimT family protein [Cyanobium sp. FGCU-6]|nr:GspH/FimT family protein [Cyanobium sp. FGCU6]